MAVYYANTRGQIMYDAMPLTAALGYPVRIPTAPITRSVRMLFKDRATLEPYQEKKKAERYKKPVSDGLTNGQRTIIRAMNRMKKATGAEMAKKIGWTSNHCSLILTSLYKMGKVDRYMARGNHTRWYVYVAKEGA
jgi:DNA-binding MarR family transcriptional regulator